MQLTINNYLRNTKTNQVFVTIMRKGSLIGMDNLYYNLYLIPVNENLETIDSGAFLLATAFQQDGWGVILRDYAENNNLEFFNPFKMTHEEAQKFLNSCRKIMEQEKTLRLGQVIINKLGEKTPTPNSEIFNSLDDGLVLEWFYNLYL